MGDDEIIDLTEEPNSKKIKWIDKDEVVVLSDEEDVVVGTETIDLTVERPRPNHQQDWVCYGLVESIITHVHAGLIAQGFAAGVDRMQVHLAPLQSSLTGIYCKRLD